MWDFFKPDLSFDYPTVDVTVVHWKMCMGGWERKWCGSNCNWTAETPDYCTRIGAFMLRTSSSKKSFADCSVLFDLIVSPDQ